jgi:hypothetical protein
MSFSRKLMEVEVIILIEIRWTQKDKEFSYTWKLKKNHDDMKVD